MHRRQTVSSSKYFTEIWSARPVLPPKQRRGHGHTNRVAGNAGCVRRWFVHLALLHYIFQSTHPGRDELVNMVDRCHLYEYDTCFDLLCPLLHIICREFQCVEWMLDLCEICCYNNTRVVQHQQVVFTGTSLLIPEGFPRVM